MIGALIGEYYFNRFENNGRIDFRKNIHGSIELSDSLRNYNGVMEIISKRGCFDSRLVQKTLQKPNKISDNTGYFAVSCIPLAWAMTNLKEIYEAINSFKESLNISEEEWILSLLTTRLIFECINQKTKRQCLLITYNFIENMKVGKFGKVCDLNKCIKTLLKFFQIMNTFLFSKDFEDCVKNSLINEFATSEFCSLISAIAEAYYLSINQKIIKNFKQAAPKDFVKTLDAFTATVAH